MLNRIIADRAADCINLKISKVGGLTKARAIRDVAVQAGIAMNIEDTWYGYHVVCGSGDDMHFYSYGCMDMDMGIPCYVQVYAFECMYAMYVCVSHKFHACFNVSYATLGAGTS
ncbi:hypothetical protein EON63_09495 [archaeon]|nr:MAG: hypothetical protein EON63_09495 [archaeon]